MLNSNPFGPQQDPGLYSFANLKRRILQDVKASGVDDRIFEAIQQAFENALRQDNVVILLSRPEKKRLLAQVMKQVLSDMLSRLDENTKL